MFSQASIANVEFTKRPMIDPILQSSIVNIVGTKIFWLILEEFEKEEQQYETLKKAHERRKKSC